MSVFLNKTIPYNEFQNKNKIMSQSNLLTPIAYKLVSHLGYTRNVNNVRGPCPTC